MEPKKADLRVRRTYKLLSEALIQLMRRLPFDKISVSDICEEAMVHRATFYSHFENKYELLKYCLGNFEAVFDKKDITADSFEGCKAYYMDVAGEVVNELEKNKNLYATILKKNRDDSIFFNVQESLEQLIAEKLQRFEQGGTHLPIGSEFLAAFYAGACISVISKWVENRLPMTSEQLLGNLSQMVLNFGD